MCQIHLSPSFIFFQFTFFNSTDKIFTLFYHFLPLYKKEADIHSTADIPGIFRKNIRQTRLFILTSFSHLHIVIKNVS